MAAIIEAEDLTKEFDGLIAVDHINFAVQEGEIFGFLGPNGAGKSTTIKMLATILNPTAGWTRVCGYDVLRQRGDVRRCLGIVFQDPSVDRFLTGKENLNFHGMVYHMDKNTREDRISEVLSLLDLEGKENTPIKDCSGGIQRRFEVARGFMARPRVLFLDEPTIGLDIQARRALWDYIRNLNKGEGITVILTTHYIEEADYLCDRVGIIDHGKIAAIDSPQRLKESVGIDLILIEIANGDGDSFSALLKGLGWVKNIEQHGSLLELSVEGGDERIPGLLALASREGIIITSVDSHKPSLEDAFLHYTGETIRESEGGIKELRKARRARRKGRR
jgi:ABC-2 type transport system ATP-binding protein